MAPRLRPPTSVWKKTCMLCSSAVGRGRAIRAAAKSRPPGRRSSAVDRDQVAVGNGSDLGGEDTNPGVVEREVAQQAVVLGGPDRVGQRLSGGSVAALQRGEHDARTVVGLGAVQLRVLLVGGLVGGGELA